VRKRDPERLLDTLLVCALIEARSCERMKLLSEALPEPGLRAFYADLLASEARHHSTYVHLATELYGREAVRSRLDALAAREAEVLTGDGEPVRVHSAVPHGA
jgi:tRNA-(ms[2]io[6]A)-hydroxylase